MDANMPRRHLPSCVRYRRATALPWCRSAQTRSRGPRRRRSRRRSGTAPSGPLRCPRPPLRPWSSSPGTARAPANENRGPAISIGSSSSCRTCVTAKPDDLPGVRTAPFCQGGLNFPIRARVLLFTPAFVNSRFFVLARYRPDDRRPSSGSRFLFAARTGHYGRTFEISSVENRSREGP